MALNIVQKIVTFNTWSLRLSMLRLTKYSTNAPIENETAFINEVDEAEKLAREQEIDQKRNKSRLYPDHYAMYHGINPYPEPLNDYHKSLRYKRRIYGKYGETSGVDPSVLWPTKEELAHRKELESVAFPFTIAQMVENVKERKAIELKEKTAREADVLAKVKTIEKRKQEFYDRVQKKAMEAAAAKERKDRIVEEIRRHFGFKMDPRDVRFQEMMEKKEKEAKKLRKMEKQQSKDQTLLQEAKAAATAAIQADAKAAADDGIDDDEDEISKSKKS